VSACDIGVYVNASWTILTVFMLRCNLVLVFVADDAKDLLIGTMIESLIVIGCLCYLNRDHVTSWINQGKRTTGGAIVTTWRVLASFIDNVKGWLILYAFIAWAIRARAELNVGRQEVRPAKDPWTPKDEEWVAYPLGWDMTRHGV
jgi:hypothetical protein